MSASSGEFAASIISLFEAIHPLDRVPRAGFLLRGVPEPESVAAHSHFVALLALFFTERYPGRYDRERLLAMALVHDLSEARLMDIPMPYADAYLNDAKHAAEQVVLDDLLSGVAPGLGALHAEFAAAETAEARLLRGLDKVQMMIKVLCYTREHRGCMEEFWTNPKNFDDYGIDEVSVLFDAICAQAGRKRPK
jgi:putative hydrolase of HD superfamily